MYNRLKTILDSKSSNNTLSRIASKHSTPSSSNLKVKFIKPSPDSSGSSRKNSIKSPSKNINSSTRLHTLIDEESYRLDSNGIIEEDYFNLNSLENESYSSKSVIKSSSKPYVKVKNLKRDLSNKSSKNAIENKSPGRFQNQRKDNSKSKLNNTSKISLYTSTSPSRIRGSKSPGKSNVFTTHRPSSKNLSDIRKPVLRKISIVNKEKESGISIDSLLNFELIKNFTSLNYKDIQLDELIYSAEISNVYRGKYLNLPVAIKVYDITKIKDEDIVRTIF